ncbi:MAG TPA: DUF305 domain-containing protein [Anaerolineales bacterium]|nr:DUF305 domain-containing protein [Anaerolineales bacterium]
MKLKWTIPVLLVTLTAAAHMPFAMDQFMQVIETSMTKMVMMPLHEDAIDMARAELSYGKDPVVRRLAEEIIVDQQSEIDAMNFSLSKKH